MIDSRFELSRRGLFRIRDSILVETSGAVNSMLYSHFVIVLGRYFLTKCC